MTDDTTEVPPAPGDYRVCAPLVRVKTMTPDGRQWRDFGDGAPLPDDVEPEHLAMLVRKRLVRHMDDPAPSGAFAWPGSMGASADPVAVQKRVVEALSTAGAQKVARSRSRRGVPRGRHAPTALSEAVSGATTAAATGDSGDDQGDDE